MFTQTFGCADNQLNVLEQQTKPVNMPNNISQPVASCHKILVHHKIAPLIHKLPRRRWVTFLTVCVGQGWPKINLTKSLNLIHVFIRVLQIVSYNGRCACCATISCPGTVRQFQQFETMAVEWWSLLNSIFIVHATSHPLVFGLKRTPYESDKAKPYEVNDWSN